MNEVTL